jgi:hypothetical protein
MHGESNIKFIAHEYLKWRHCYQLHTSLQYGKTSGYDVSELISDNHTE